MHDSAMLHLRFDPERLKSDLGKIEESAWIDHFVKQNYKGSWSVVPLRGPTNATHPVQMIYSDPGCSDFSNTPFLDECCYLQEVLARFECPLHAVRLMKLAPGSVIKEHVDYDLSIEDGNARLHIPVTTSDKVRFNLNGRRIVMNEGECWYLRLSDPHSVVNCGTDDRVHLVIDAVVNRWLSERIADRQPGAPTES
jgi:hypothetical protein